jgi:hypothetical protein
MDHRHSDALRRIAQADAMWAADGHEPRAFLLMYLGGMEKRIDHPRWDPSWSTPGTSTIDDLAELGYLRVSGDVTAKGRAFELTMEGRKKTAELDAERRGPARDLPHAAVASPKPPAAPAGAPAPTAVVSWAHGDHGWQTSVAEFAFRLREFGVDVDLDLWHLHDPSVDWATYGPREIQARQFVLIPVSRAYKERWEGKAAVGTGAGAAREANTLKALFEEDQDAFRRKVKIILLPGATVPDIPTELRSTVQHFPVPTLDLVGLEALLRTLTGQPEFVAPELGPLPLLPPRSLDRAGAAPEPPDTLAAAIAGLPEREKLVIALTYFERLTRDEIAKILDVNPNAVSGLAQDATSRLGAAMTADLARTYDEPASVRRHTAHKALLADGPRAGHSVPIHPEQGSLALTERFDVDQGFVDVVDHYAYEGRTGNDPDTVVFTFRHQEHRVGGNR